MGGDKPALRRELRARRRALRAGEHAAGSERAARAIAKLARFSAGRRVAIYLPFDCETDTAALITAARRRGVRIYVPVIADRRHRRLRFHPLDGGTRRGTYGIRVPHRSGRPVAARWFDLIVVPLVGIDPDGRRLGLGGGFYDRVIAFRAQRRHWRGPQLVGLGFDCQRVETVFADRWDLELDALATESRLHHYRRGSA